MADPQEPRRSFLFSFGLDRIGLIALRAPHVAATLVLLLTALAILGFMRLKVDDSLSELFRTDTKEFRQYEEIDRRFPSSEYDVLVVVEGQDLLKQPQLKAFSDAVVELQLTDGAGGVVSMLSARDKPDASGFAPAIIPDELPSVGPDYDALLDKLRSNDIVKGKFLSDDGTLAMVVIALDRDVVKDKTAKVVIGDIQTVLDEKLKDTGLVAKLTGAPVMQLEIRNAVERDRLVYNGLGALAGMIVAYLFFRRLSLTIITVLGPAIAILWTLGVLGGLDFRLNLFINVITPLILVSGFSDSMHLVFSIRRSMAQGIPRLEAARNAVLDVAPACLLTAMIQAISIISFAFADSGLIRTFGYAALLAVAISYLAVAIVVPTLAVLLIQDEEPSSGDLNSGEDRGGVLQSITSTMMGTAATWPVIFVLLGLAGVGATGWAYQQLVPMYRLADQVPDKEQALDATARLDKKLTGANPVHVMIQWKGGKDAADGIKLYDVATLSVIARTHDILETEAGLGNVWSLESLRRWLAAAGDASIETVQKYVGLLPGHLVRRFITEDESSVLVTARLPDIDSSEILPKVELIDKALDPLRLENPGFEISVTGLPAIAARNSAKLIGDLNWGLLGDIFLVFIFLGVVLRSFLAGFSSILPALFPIFATGALLWFFGQGLQFASIVAITVAFSLAIDSTVHFLNRFRLEETKLGPGPGNHLEALKQTAHHIGPAVVMTTIVLALGLGVTMLSTLPSLRLFGQLTAVCLFASLAAQLLILPATISLFRRWFPLK